MQTKDYLLTETYPLLGLRCTSCAAKVERILLASKGVKIAQVNLALAEINLTYNPNLIKLADCQQLIKDAGYQLVIEKETNGEKRESIKATNEYKRQTYVALVLSLPIMLLSMLWMHETWAMWLSWLLTSLILFYSGRDFYSRAYKQLTGGGMGMDTLVSLSTGAAYLYSTLNLALPQLIRSIGQEPHLYFEASAMIIAFVLLGKLLEERAKGNASVAIETLMKLQPMEVICLDKEGNERKCRTDEVHPGDNIVVRPGERIPIDGFVLIGQSHTDESMLTGESTPVYKEQGTLVYAGTTNLDGVLKIEANTDYHATRLAQIIRLVKDAQGSKAPIQKFADRVAAHFVILILIIALLTLIAWLLIGGHNAISNGLISSITVLIISCPCALGLATPLAIVVAVGQAAKRGILIRDAESLEAAHNIEAIALDKTGTLTEGKPHLCSELWYIEKTAQLIGVLVSMERKGLHPLGRAVLEAYSSRSECLQLDSWSYTAGLGSTAEAIGKDYYLGNLRLLESHGIYIPQEANEAATTWAERGESLTYFASKEGLIALFGVQDSLKVNVIEAVRELKRRGLHLYMLTGDKKSVAERIAQQVGIDEVQAECLPKDKVDFVRKLQERHSTAMVGDGINDGAALAKSDLSIAMGHGSEVAMQTAMVTILSSDLGKISDLISLSRRTVRIMQQNLFWAFSYNLIAIPLATGLLTPLLGYQMTPMWASIAMSISSLLVVLNSLRLRHALRSRASHF